MMNLVDHVNEATRRAEQEMKIFDLQGILDKGEELRLVQDKRVLIREGPIKLLRMGGSGSLKKLECYSFLLDRTIRRQSTKNFLITPRHAYICGFRGHQEEV